MPSALFEPPLLRPRLAVVLADERDDAVLFSFSDLPSMAALGLHREEALADNDGHQKLAH